VSRPVLIVYNPVSGRGLGVRFAERLAEALTARGRAVERLETRSDVDVYRDLDTSAFDGIVVVGGDGSLHAAVNGLRSVDLPIGFGGTGTVNVLSLEASLTDDPERVADLYVAGRTARVPLLSANGRRWVLFTEAGFLGSVVRSVNRWRAASGKHGKLEFVASALRILPCSWGRPLLARYVTTSGERRERRYANVLATRARRYAGNMPLPMDGVGLGVPHFQLVGFRTRTPFGHLFLLSLAGMRLLPLARPLLSRLGLIDCVPCVSLEIEGPPEAGVHVDAESEVGGDELGLPLSVGTTNASFELVVP